MTTGKKEPQEAQEVGVFALETEMQARPGSQMKCPWMAGSPVQTGQTTASAHARAGLMLQVYDWQRFWG